MLANSAFQKDKRLFIDESKFVNCLLSSTMFNIHSMDQNVNKFCGPCSDKFQMQSQSDLVPQTVGDMTSETSSKASKASGKFLFSCGFLL